jgi:nitrite reductase/ring-hydroxylating ferredoxin subunit
MASTQQSFAVADTARSHRAPAADRIPQYPPSWFRFCASRLLRDKPLSKEILGRKLVAYRCASGKVVVMDALCSHLAADLGRGTVRGENIQCPFHGWEYDPTGACAHVPGEESLPPFARQTVYPTVERHGSVFIFNGTEALFPLPFFMGANPEDYVAGRPFEIRADCSWFMIAANGFDAAHFRVVHDRTMLSAPMVDTPAPYSRRMSYHAEVTGDSVFDAILRRGVGRTVDITITNWGGAFVLVTGDFQGARSRILIAVQPLEEHKSKVEVIVFAPRRKSRLAGRLVEFLSLEVRRLFTEAFMKHDVDRLPGIVYRPDSLLSSEHELIGFFSWLSELPHSTLQPQCAQAGKCSGDGARLAEDSLTR